MAWQASRYEFGTHGMECEMQGPGPVALDEISGKVWGGDDPQAQDNGVKSGSRLGRDDRRVACDAGLSTRRFELEVLKVFQ